MATPISTRLRSSEKFIADASSPAVTNSFGAAPQSVGLTVNKKSTPNKVAVLHSEVHSVPMGREHFSPAEPAAGRRIVPQLAETSTPAASINLSGRLLGSRPYLDSTKSSSTTGSSVRSNETFDSPLWSPLGDWPQSSPEQADPTENEVRYLKHQPRSKHRPLNDKSQESCETESQARAAGERKKASGEDPVTSPVQNEVSSSEYRLKLPAWERQRSSSAPSVPTPTKSRSSSINPISKEIKRHLVLGMASLTLGDKCDETGSPQRAGATPDGFGKNTGEYMGQLSSASGIVEKGITTRSKTAAARSGPDNQSGDSIDNEALATSRLDRPEKSLQLNGPAPLSTAAIEKRDGGLSVPKDSPISSHSVRTASTKAGSRRLKKPQAAQQITTEYAIPQVIYHAPEKSPPRPIRPVNTSGVSPGSSSARKSLKNAKSTAGDGLEADSVPQADRIQQNGVVPEIVIAPDTNGASALDRGPQYPVFERFDNNVCYPRDIRAKLIALIDPKTCVRACVKAYVRAPTKIERGYIYVYTFEPSTPAVRVVTAQEHKYFKIGLTGGEPSERTSAQKNLLRDMNLIRIEDDKQRQFDFAGIVDDLIKCDLHNYRRKTSYQDPKSTRKGGSPKMHDEWYECDKQQVLDCIEKWRGWVTKCSPFNSKGLPKPCWVWKLRTLDQDKEGVSLDSLLHPFTWKEDLSYRKYWLTELCKDLYAQAVVLVTALGSSPLLVSILSIGLILFHTLGLKRASVRLALLGSLAAYIASGR